MARRPGSIDANQVNFSEAVSQNVTISGDLVVSGSNILQPSRRINENIIALDGTDDRIMVSTEPEFTFNDGTNDLPFSISAWIYVVDVSVSNGTIVGKFTFSSTGNEWMFKQEYGKLHFYMYDNTLSGTGDQKRIIASSITLSDNTWHHVVVTCAGGNDSPGYTLYTDGASHSGTQQFVNNYVRTRFTDAPLTIGAADLGSGNRIFEDRLGDVVIFNKELSSAEVTELYNNGSVKDMRNFSAYDSILSWWKMGDDLDSTATNGIRDYVSGFHGTLQNGASIVADSTLASDLVGPTSIDISGSLGIGVTNPEASLHVHGSSKLEGDVTISGSVSMEDYMILSVTADNTDIQTGTSQFTFRAPFAMKLIRAPRASLSTASSSGVVTVDINVDGTSIFQNPLDIDANETTSLTADDYAHVVSGSIADDSQITVDIDSAGTGARGLKVTLYYRKVI